MNPIKGILVAAGLSCSAVFAGTESSGGGGAVVCHDANKNITFAQLYDLYEANTLNNYGITSSNTDPNIQLKTALDTLGNANFQWLESVIMNKVPDLINNIKFLPAGVVFAPPEDLGPGIVMPDGCEIEGVGYYDTNGVLNISADIYAAFSNTDRAAFFLHEAIYFIDRTQTGATTSKFSRSVNAALFAPNGTTNSSAQQAVAWASNTLTTPLYVSAPARLLVTGVVTSAAPFPDFNIQMFAVLTNNNQFTLTGLCTSFWDQNQIATSLSTGSSDFGSNQSVVTSAPDTLGCDVLWLSGAITNKGLGYTSSNWQLQITSGTDMVFPLLTVDSSWEGTDLFIAIPHINIALPVIPTPPTLAHN